MSLTQKDPTMEAKTNKTVLVWTYFEHGHEDAFFQAITQNLPSLSSVSIIAYVLNETGQFACMDPDNETSEVCPYWDDGNTKVHALGLSTMPTISLPPGYIGTGVGLLLNSDQSSALQKEFIQAAIDMANKLNFSGYCIDWENSDDASINQLADFLNTFSDAMHKVGKKTCIATEYDGFLDPDVLANTSVDLLCDMETYTSSDEEFVQAMQDGIKAVGGVDRYGCGLDPTNDYPNSSIKFRFKKMATANVQNICIWEDHIEDIPATMWQDLAVYLSTSTSTSTST